MAPQTNLEASIRRTTRRSRRAIAERSRHCVSRKTTVTIIPWWLVIPFPEFTCQSFTLGALPKNATLIGTFFEYSVCSRIFLTEALSYYRFFVFSCLRLTHEKTEI